MNPVKSEDQLYIRKKKHNYLESCFLPEIGSQGVVSEIISGKRQLNVRQLTKESIIEKTYSSENLPSPLFSKEG